MTLLPADAQAPKVIGNGVTKFEASLQQTGDFLVLLVRLVAQLQPPWPSLCPMSPSRVVQPGFGMKPRSVSSHCLFAACASAD
jgi:hypothetical protein